MELKEKNNYTEESVFLNKLNFDEKNFILIRGHQGSGKSTLAKNIANAAKEFGLNESDIFHIERDFFMYDENGEYSKVFNQEVYKKADDKFRAAFSDGFNKKPKLIIVSNVHNNLGEIINYKSLAENKKGKRNERYNFNVLRTQNGFQNLHNVPSEHVQSVYLNMKNFNGEYLIKPVKPMNVNKLDRDNLPFNEEYQTYITKEYEIFKGKTFIKKEFKEYPNLYLLKYSSAVFFDGSFDNALLEMRGTVIDKDYNIIVRPFKKVFNKSDFSNLERYKEPKIDDNQKLNVVTKVNGFLGVCTYVSKMDEVLYSTTGSLVSDFAKMNKKHTEKHEQMFKDYPDVTFCFEICDENDPHIIKENIGEVLIGMIDVKTGFQYPESKLDEVAKNYNVVRPETFKGVTYSEFKEMLNKTQTEGFMVFDENDNLLFKAKSPYYLINKLFARGTDVIEKLNSKTNNAYNYFDEEFHPLITHLKDKKVSDKFLTLNEAEKVEYIRNYLNEEFKELYNKKENIKSTKVKLN